MIMQHNANIICSSLYIFWRCINGDGLTHLLCKPISLCHSTWKALICYRNSNIIDLAIYNFDYICCHCASTDMSKLNKQGTRVMVFNATFNNISVITWRSDLLVEEIGLSTENWAGFELTTLVVIDTDCTGSCKSNYHTITTRTAP